MGCGADEGVEQVGPGPLAPGEAGGELLRSQGRSSGLEATCGVMPVRKEGRSAQNRELLGPGRGLGCWTGQGLGPSCPVLSLKQRWPPWTDTWVSSPPTVTRASDQAGTGGVGGQGSPSSQGTCTVRVGLRPERSAVLSPVLTPSPTLALRRALC